jgi:hypothetical protein
MEDYRDTHKMLIKKIKKSMKEEMKFKIGLIKFYGTEFRTNFIVYFQEDKFEAKFNISQKLMFFKKSDDFKTLFYNFYLKRIDIYELQKLYNEKGNWNIFLSIMLEIISEMSISNFKQTKEYKLRNLYDKEYELFFNNLVCLYADKINEYSYFKNYGV